jgi:hypothetical protein
MPETSSGVAARAFRFITLSTARELGILLCLSVMFPFMIHVIPVPEDSQLGPRLLPIFYAPLLAALLRRSATAATVALLAPWLNWALTSHPAPPGAIVMTVELVVFVLAMRALLARAGPRWYLAAPAFVFCKAASALAAASFPALIGGREPLAWAAQGIAIGVPGIAILLLINWLVPRFYPPGAAGGGPRLA